MNQHPFQDSIGTVGKTEVAASHFKLTSGLPVYWDSVTKTSLLTVLAGYLEQDEITVHDDPYYDATILDSFLSYMLNDKRAAPREYSLKARFARDAATEQLSDQTCLNHQADCFIAFSGGLDSTAGILYALDQGWCVQPIWLGFGQKNEEQERLIVQQLSQTLGIDTCYITVALRTYVDAGWQRWKSGIIPGRNFLFASFAAQIAARSLSRHATIYLCAHKEEITDINTDKSLRFFHTCSSIFSQAYRKEITIGTPFLHITKSEIVSYWRRHWQDKYRIEPQDTVSCYFGNNCGACKACINRAIAFSCADQPLGAFAVNPFRDVQNVIASDYLQRFASFDLDRKLDLIYSLQQHRSLLGPELEQFLLETLPQYDGMIPDRLRRIREAKIEAYG